MEDKLKATRKLLAVHIEEPFLSQIMQVIEMDFILEYQRGKMDGVSALANAMTDEPK